MKIIALFFTLCAALAAVPMEKPAENPADCYPLAAVVVECDDRNDLVTVEDAAGNLWQFYGVEDWHPGDIAAMIMDGKNTPIIYDDEIVPNTIRYAGWPELFAEKAERSNDSNDK